MKRTIDVSKILPIWPFNNNDYHVDLWKGFTQQLTENYELDLKFNNNSNKKDIVYFSFTVYFNSVYESHSNEDDHFKVISFIYQFFMNMDMMIDFKYDSWQQEKMWILKFHFKMKTKKLFLYTNFWYGILDVLENESKKITLNNISIKLYKLKITENEYLNKNNR